MNKYICGLMCGDWRVGSELEVSYFVDVSVKFEWWFIVCMVYYSSVKGA
ncbi:hypothetical protein KSF78_0002311 [Schistosoma japonicum]|nr:hypothetical protein KSF78_0002311 [Schistosoma japonicum]